MNGQKTHLVRALVAISFTITILLQITTTTRGTFYVPPLSREEKKKSTNNVRTNVTDLHSALFVIVLPVVAVSAIIRR